MNPVTSLLKSRKILLLIFGIVQSLVLHYLSVPPDIWQAIDALIIAVIAGIALEDAGAKSSGSGPSA